VEHGLVTVEFTDAGLREIYSRAIPDIARTLTSARPIVSSSAALALAVRDLSVKVGTT